MSSQRIRTLLNVLIGALLIIGALRTIASFYEGFSLIGLAALLYLGVAVLKQLTTLNELLKYSLFKQGTSPKESGVAAAAAQPRTASYSAQRRTREVQ